jgi:rod shape determining protein RodA
MFDRRLVQHFDWGLLCLTMMIAAFGMITLFSAVKAVNLPFQKTLCFKQMIWFSAGLAVMSLAFLFNYKLLDRWANIIYVCSVILLILVLVAGKHVSGSRRWLSLGPISLQPSELVKISVIIVLAQYYSKISTPKGMAFRELFKPGVLVLIPFCLIVKQPDLGTALLLVFIAASVTIFARIELRTLFLLTSSCVLMGPLIWLFLKGYQKQRILTFLNPDRDPLGAGYHIIQSKIAIGSGQFLGKGFMKGTQNALSFLPEQHTDFIFSVMAEEWGFLGSAFVLILFFLLIVWALNIAYKCHDNFGVILAVGISAMLFWQVLINIGMVMGLLPVVGVPLPLISYGGSSIITTMASIGLLLNVSMRKFMFE